MWMSEPTPVISRTKLMDSGSTSRSMPTLNAPTSMKSHRCTVRRRSPASYPSIWANIATPTANDATDVATPSRCPHRSVRLPPIRRIAAPASGSAMRSQDAAWMPSAFIPVLSVLQQVHVVHRRRPAGPEDGHDDRQADHDLRGGHHHHEEGDDLTVQVAVHAGERDERKVRRVQHQLDAHEHHERVAAPEHADGADGGQDRRERQVVLQTHEPASPSPFFPPAPPPEPPAPPGPPSTGDPDLVTRDSASASSASPVTALTSRTVLSTASSGVAPYRSACRSVVSTLAAMIGLTDSSDGVPSGSSAGMSTALCRA